MDSLKAHRHVFDAGGRCTKCGKSKSTRGRPPGSPLRLVTDPPPSSAGAAPPPSPPPLGRSLLDRLNALDDRAPTAVEEEEERASAGPPTWCGIAGDLIADGMVGLIGVAIRAKGREPGPCDPGKKVKLAEALGVQLARWFPDTEAGPLTTIVMCSVGLAGGMWVTGTPIEEKDEAKSPPAAATAATVP